MTMDIPQFYNQVHQAPEAERENILKAYRIELKNSDLKVIEIRKSIFPKWMHFWSNSSFNPTPLINNLRQRIQDGKPFPRNQLNASPQAAWLLKRYVSLADNMNDESKADLIAKINYINIMSLKQLRQNLLFQSSETSNVNGSQNRETVIELDSNQEIVIELDPIKEEGEKLDQIEEEEEELELNRKNKMTLELPNEP